MTPNRPTETSAALNFWLSRMISRSSLSHRPQPRVVGQRDAPVADLRLDPVLRAAVADQMDRLDRVADGRQLEVPAVRTGAERADDGLAARAAERLEGPGAGVPG